MSVTRLAPPHLDRLMLDEIDWSRCSGRDLHRLAEGAAQAAVRLSRPPKSGSIDP